MGAVGFAGGAAAATVPDQEMGKDGPILPGHDFDQGLLHFYGVVLTGQSHAAGKATDMGVHDDAFGQIESVTENHIRGLSAHPGQFVQVLHGPRNLTAVVFHQSSGTTTDGLGFGAEEAGRADQALEFRGWDFRKVLGRPAADKEGGGDFVDPFVGALGGKDRGHQELKRVGVVQLAVGGRVGLF